MNTAMYHADPPLRRSMLAEKQAPARFPLLKPESTPQIRSPKAKNGGY
jgi:hypothetical protein